MYCVNVEGSIFFFFFVFVRLKLILYDLLVGLYRNVWVEFIDKGWMDVEIFRKCIYYLYVYVVKERLIVLLIDSVGSYVDMEFFFVVKELGIEIYWLVRNVIYFM